MFKKLPNAKSTTPITHRHTSTLLVYEEALFAFDTKVAELQREVATGKYLLPTQDLVDLVLILKMQSGNEEGPTQPSHPVPTCTLIVLSPLYKPACLFPLHHIPEQRCSC